VVVGGGPTGIAALVHARLEGIDAVGLEAGDQPLAAVAGYMEQLVLVSRSTHYEVAGIPLDCRDPDELTREDLLSYYARVLTLARAELRCRARCRALVPHADHVEVVLDGGPPIEAEQVIVAAWYEPRPSPPELAPVDGGPEVRRWLARPSQATGRRVAFVGGGMSAFEQSSAVMMLGQPVHVVARGPLAAFFRGERYQQLVALTGSTIIADGGEIAVDAGGLSWRGTGGGAGRVDCDLVVTCVGSRLAPAIGALLADAGVLDTDPFGRLAAAPTVEELTRTGRARDHADAIAQTMAARPDLWPLLFDGAARIRLAGGALHGGGADAGVVSSILTARLAVEAIAGRSPPPGWQPPLPRAIYDWCGPEPWREPPPFERIAALRPMTVASWTRGTPRLLSEDAAGGLRDAAGGHHKYLLGPLAGNEVAGQVLDAADGTLSIADLAEEAELETAEERADLVRVLCGLFRSNALTWLPPTGAWP
jgi:hypothetical protein